jgi:tetratricopeptide (TPR) repeat protein
MFPAALLLHAWWRRGRVAASDLRATAPFFAISGAMGAVTLWFQVHRAISYWNLPVLGLPARIAQAGLSLQFYFWKCLVPLNLMPIYPRWNLEPTTALQFLPCLAIVAIFLGLWGWGRGRQWPRHLIFGLGWFVLFLLPVLGFLPMAYQHVAPVADHLCYVSLAGLVGVFAAGIGAGPAGPGLEPVDREGRKGRIRRLFGFPILPEHPVQVLCVLLVAGLAVESRRYAAVFVDQETMWTYNQARNPRSAAIYVNLGFIQHHDGKLEASIGSYQEAIRLDPRDAQAEDELAGVYVDDHKPDQAIAHYRRALELQPTLEKTRGSLAKALADSGRPAEAAAQYERMIHDDPRDATAEANLGKLLDDQGRHLEAKTHLERALALDPASPGAQNDLGMVFVGLGEPIEGIKHIAEALRIRPDFPEAENNLGFALAGMGRQVEAIPHLREALRLKPAFAQAENNLGYALAATGRGSEAITQLENALKLSPGDAKAHYNLAMLLEAAGRDREALHHLESALALKPDLEPARVALRHLRVLLIAAGKE